jgi:hypothetical protein
MLKVSHKHGLRDLTQIKEFAFGTIAAAFRQSQAAVSAKKGARQKFQRLDAGQIVL